MLELLMKNKLHIAAVGIWIALLTTTMAAPPATLAGTNAVIVPVPQSNVEMFATTDKNTHNNTACKHPSAMWGDPNPNIFYICDADSQTALQLHCAEGHGFFNGLGYYGCIPYDRWPACITAPKVATPTRTPLQLPQQPLTVCDSDHMQQPWESIDPNKFFTCSALNAEPLLLSCAEGKGFMQAEIVGCVSWVQWRAEKQCVNFY